MAKAHCASCRKHMEDSTGKSERGQRAKPNPEKRWIHWTANESEKDKKKVKQGEASQNDTGGASTSGNRLKRRSGREGEDGNGDPTMEDEAKKEVEQTG